MTNFRFQSLQEIADENERDRWRGGPLSQGDWRFLPETRVVRHVRTSYEVDLDQARTSAELLDWVFQLHGKTWVTPTVIHDFLTIVDRLLRPQATLCSCGVERGPINVAATLERIATRGAP